jgi:murein L,D-transpeptidase YcbB/YkuD
MTIEDLSQAAVHAGREAGWDHANYYAAYGATRAPESIDVPTRYAAHMTYYTAGFDEGMRRFADDCYPDGSPVVPYANE